jgi:hypothetical protein
MNTSRRHFIASTATAVALAKLAPLFAAELKPRFQIGACDWSIGKQADRRRWSSRSRSVSTACK